jgi:predicted MPP superfamily phosphohydrolase
MKILVFGDSHLTDKFNLEWFDYIANLIKSADQVIINGDFWDGYLTTFDKFCESSWKNLFPLLKEKNTVYLFGNHDKEHFMDQRMNLFSYKQGLKHTLQSGEKIINIEHGHLIAPAYDDNPLFGNQKIMSPIFKFLMGILAVSKPIRKMQHGWEYTDGLKMLEKYIQSVAKKFDKKYYHIFNHSHVHKIIPQMNIINLGVLQSKRRHYLLIENGKFNIIPRKQQHEL